MSAEGPQAVLDACEGVPAQTGSPGDSSALTLSEAACDAAVAGFGTDAEYTKHCGIKFTAGVDGTTYTGACEQTYSIRAVDLDFVRPGRGYVAPKLLQHRRRGEFRGCSSLACDGRAVSERDALYTPCQSAETLTGCFDADVTVSADTGEVVDVRVTSGGEFRLDRDDKDNEHKYIGIRSTAGACENKNGHFCSVATCGLNDDAPCATEAMCVAEPGPGVWAANAEPTRALCEEAGKAWHAGVEGVCAHLNTVANDASTPVLTETVFSHGETRDIAAIALGHKRLLACARKQDVAECRLLDLQESCGL